MHTYVKELISSGYAYRFCLLGDLTPHKVNEWEAKLLEEAQKINPSAAVPRVIHGGHLLGWAEQLLAIIAWIRNVTQGVFHWDAWSENCRAVTKKYVPNPEWEYVQDQVRQHSDFAAQPVGGVPTGEKL